MAMMFGMTSNNELASLFSDSGDGIFDKLESLKVSVEEINDQFRDPTLTTFVCVCIPEFLSLYETERLVQELASYEIDSHNIVINQIIFPEQVQGNRLLLSRVRMQQKYLAQFDELYGEDFHMVKVPLLDREVRGKQDLSNYGKFLIKAPTPEQLIDIAEGRHS